MTFATWSVLIGDVASSFWTLIGQQSFWGEFATAGPFAVLSAFLIFHSIRREERMTKRINELEGQIHGSLIQLVASTTEALNQSANRCSEISRTLEALEECSRQMAQADEMLRRTMENRPCQLAQVNLEKLMRRQGVEPERRAPKS